MELAWWLLRRDAVLMPQRIQLSRKKGWRKPEGAVVVSRPTTWGNPFAVVPVRPRGPFDVMRGECFVGQSTGLESARAMAVRHFRAEADEGRDGFSVGEIRAELAGKDLACWCSLDQPCHADVLLELANAEVAE